jgi:hypothetical protein
MNAVSTPFGIFCCFPFTSIFDIISSRFFFMVGCGHLIMWLIISLVDVHPGHWLMPVTWCLIWPYLEKVHALPECALLAFSNDVPSSLVLIPTAMQECVSVTGLTDMTPTAKKIADITECCRHVGMTLSTCLRQTKCLSFEGWSRQTQIPTLPTKLELRGRREALVVASLGRAAIHISGGAEITGVEW